MAKSKTIVIPEKWSEVKYKDYYRFIKAIEGEEEDNKFVIEMALQYICNLDVDDYYRLDKDTFDSITADVSNLLGRQEKQPLVYSFNLFDTEYRINPKIEDMSYGEYLDLTTYSKDLWANFPIICSILYRPVDKTLGAMYTVKSYTGTNDDTVQMFRDMLTTDIVNGVLAFFLTLQKDLLTCSLKSSMKKLKKELTPQQVEDLAKSGVDIKHLLPLVEETYSNLTK